MYYLIDPRKDTKSEPLDIEDITLRRKDINCVFEWSEKQYFKKRAARVCKILFLTRESKIYNFKLPGNYFLA